MSSKEQPKVLIAGAGPTGLIAALTLVKNGVPVRVIEKSTTPRIGQRGAGIMPRTFEVFESLGFLEEAMKYTISVPKMRVYKPGSVTEVLKEYWLHEDTDPTPDRPYINPRLLGQENLDKVLRGRLAALDCHIELGVELEKLTYDNDKVHVSLKKSTGDGEEATYDYLIGADGARSIIRKTLDLSFFGETTEHKTAVGEFMAEGLDANIWHMWGNIQTYMLSIRPTETPGLFTFITGGRSIPDPAPVIESEETLKAYIKERLPGREDIKIGKIRWMGTYITHIRMIDTFKKGRVFVTGDAAHVHSPTGAQGMNTGIQDSLNIAWKLALVLKGVSPASILETVTEERVPVVAEMLELTTSVLKTTILQGNSAWKRPEAVKQFGVNYRSSSLVLDDGADADEARNVSSYGGGGTGHVFAGDRAPDAPGLVKIGTQETTRLFELLGPDHHTVFVFADKGENVYQPSSAVTTKYPNDLVRFAVIHAAGKAPGQQSDSVAVFEDSKGHAYDAYKDSQGVSGVFVVRPDGFVGARLANLDKVEQYFKGVFGDKY